MQTGSNKSCKVPKEKEKNSQKPCNLLINWKHKQPEQNNLKL